MNDAAYSILCLLIFLLHVWLMLWCYRRNPIIFPGMLTLFNGMLLVFISLFLIERGFWMFELEQDGFRNYAFLYYCLFSVPVILLVATTRFCNSFIEKVKTTRYETRPLAFTIFFLLFNLVFIVQADFRSAWLMGDKFTVLSFSPFGTKLYFINNFVLIVATYYLFNSRPDYFRFILALFVMNGIMRHAVVCMLLSLGLPLILRMVVKNGCRYYLPRTSVLVIPVIAGLALFVRNLYFNPEVSPITLYDRIISQGQLFWVSINERYDGSLLDILIAYLQSTFSLKNLQLQPDFGLGHFMIAVSNVIGAKYVEGGVSFAAAPPGMFIYYSNLVVGWLIYMAAAWAAILCLKHYVKALLMNRLGEFVILNLILTYFVLNFFLMGEYSNLNFRAVLFVILYLIVKLFSQKGRLAVSSSSRTDSAQGPSDGVQA
jgi:hypothetical protein